MGPPGWPGCPGAAAHCTDGHHGRGRNKHSLHRANDAGHNATGTPFYATWSRSIPFGCSAVTFLLGLYLGLRADGLVLRHAAVLQVANLGDSGFRVFRGAECVFASEVSLQCSVLL